MVASILFYYCIFVVGLEYGAGGTGETEAQKRVNEENRMGK